MCYSDDARPPDHDLGGPVASTEDIVLTADDGNRFAAHLARPKNPDATGIVILPDVRGLHRFYRALARRFAEAGFDAIAIDYFGRTAGIRDASGDFDYQPHVTQTQHATIAVDVTAALDHLRALGDHRNFTVGFCFGGADSWRQSAAQPGLSGAIGFYGRPAAAGDCVDAMSAPSLLLLAGADRTPRAELSRSNNN